MNKLVQVMTDRKQSMQSPKSKHVISGHRDNLGCYLVTDIRSTGANSTHDCFSNNAI